MFYDIATEDVDEIMSLQKRAGVYIIESFFITLPPAFDFLPRDALLHVPKSMIFFPKKQ